MIQKEIFSYKDINKFAKKLADMINYKDFGKDIITFTKGGLFSSAYVCNYLNWKPTVYSLGEDVCLLQDNAILVDDILDTGKTTKKLFSKSNHSYTCYYLTDKPNKGRIFTPKNYYSSHTIKDEKWAVFPWEVM